MKPLIAIGAVVVFGALPADALAGGGGGQGGSSPGSPAGQQYQIPVVAARGETAGNKHKSHAKGGGAVSRGGGGTAGGGTAGNGGNAPLFGAGITPSSSVHAAAGSSRSRTRLHSRKAGARPKDVSAPRVLNGAGRELASSTHRGPLTSVGGSSGDGWAVLAGGGLLVLLVGGGGGFALRRRLLRA